MSHPENLPSTAAINESSLTKWEFVFLLALGLPTPDLELFTPGGFTKTDRIMLVAPRGKVSASFNGLNAAVAPAVVAEIENRRKHPALTRSD